MTISYPYELSGEAVHRKAAIELCVKMGWRGEIVGGSLKNGYVFVFVGNVYSRAEIVNGTGFESGARFAQI